MALSSFGWFGRFWLVLADCKKYGLVVRFGWFWMAVQRSKMVKSSVWLVMGRFGLLWLILAGFCSFRAFLKIWLALSRFD